MKPTVEQFMEEILSEMQSLRASVEALSAEVAQLKSPPTHKLVYPFGEEPNEELPAKAKVRHLLSRPNDCIPGLFRLILQTPKTRNVHMPNLRGEYIELWMSNRWKTETSKGALVKIVDHMLTLLNCHYQAGMHGLYAKWMENSMMDMTAEVDKVTDRVWKEQMKKCKAVLVEFRNTVVKKRRNCDAICDSSKHMSRDELDNESATEGRRNKRLRAEEEVCGEDKQEESSEDCTEEDEIEVNGEVHGGQVDEEEEVEEEEEEAEEEEEEEVEEMEDEVEEEEESMEGEGDREESDYDDSSEANEQTEDEKVCKYPRQPIPKKIRITRTTTTDEYELPSGTYVPFGGCWKDKYIPQRELTKSVDKLGYPDACLLTQINLSFKFHEGRWLLHANKGDGAFARFNEGVCEVWRRSTKTWDVDHSISCHF